CCASVPSPSSGEAATSAGRNGSGTSVVPSCSRIRAASTKLPPAPPRASGKSTPSQPNSPILRQTSRLQPTGSARRARRRVTGDSRLTKLATVLTRSCCSSDSSKFMRVVRPLSEPEDELGDDVLLDLVAAAVDRGGAQVVEQRRH